MCIFILSIPISVFHKTEKVYLLFPKYVLCCGTKKYLLTSLYGTSFMHSVVLLHFLLVIFYYMFLFFIHNDANWDSEASFKFMFISELIAMVWIAPFLPCLSFCVKFIEYFRVNLMPVNLHQWRSVVEIVHRCTYNRRKLG